DVGGLHVLGSARHDSRRIDRQLRGRCARQGDPGSSRFYVSLEDNLMRLFGSDRVSSIMEKLGMEEGEELSHPWLNKSIQRAQRRVEQQHFSFRKRTLEYDDVMNKQREIVYGLRREILTSEDPRGMLFDFVNTAVSEHVESAFEQPSEEKSVDIASLATWLTTTFPVHFDEQSLKLKPEETAEQLIARIVDEIDRVYTLKEKTEQPEMLRWAERQVMLTAIDRLYQEHLYSMDDLRQGVQLRAYGQRDPLVEYKQEAYHQFSSLMDDIKQEIVDNMFRSMAALAAMRARISNAPRQQIHQSAPQVDPADAASQGGEDQQQAGPPQPLPVRRVQPKVGRNEPCPCGSGKKYKHCCGR
ncbi:MAG: SEC-C metal-binding domain-containing protein, partial [bacterium]